MQLQPTVGCCSSSAAVPIGGERWSFTGFVSAMRAFDVNKGAAVIFLIGACFWSLEALWSFWCLKSVGGLLRTSILVVVN
jgi:hypothetical protein